MSEGTKDFALEAVVEANDLLQEEVTRLRASHKTLRSVIKALRTTLTTYRGLLEISKYNDELFKSLCEGAFDAPVALTGKGGLPETESGVESTVRNGEEASATA
jgi:hypothetical protein